MRRGFSIALVHHPVVDASAQVCTSTLTTMDVHDLSRSARTYGCTHFFVVHPIEAQRALADKIVEHWTYGSSAKRIPDRKDALSLVRVVETLEEASKTCGPNTETWITAARATGATTSWPDARALLTQGREDGSHVLLVFGTSWGLAPEVIERAAVRLAPILGVGPWNHLSVRAACAIALDRLAGSV